jgi:hypothetical protein
MNNQRGYIDLNLVPIFWLAGIGLLALIIGIPYGIYWLLEHVEVIVK